MYGHKINHISNTIQHFSMSSLYDRDIEEKIIQIVKEHVSNPHGITKTELTRIFAERWGTSKTTLWDYIRDLIDSGKIDLIKTKKQQHALFIPKLN